MNLRVTLYRCKCGTERSAPPLEMTTESGRDANLFCLKCRKMTAHLAHVKTVPFPKRT